MSGVATAPWSFRPPSKSIDSSKKIAKNVGCLSQSGNSTEVRITIFRASMNYSRYVLITKAPVLSHRTLPSSSNVFVEWMRRLCEVYNGST
jgi:hypothetical protein